eukprot:GHVU01146321.1.p1 GENE.GHVU01146321.1~~GHVU01146321.1.p1  ORF type:complete len:362 (+),score=26.09 GHVU01146321.1:215-1300(+)
MDETPNSSNSGGDIRNGVACASPQDIMCNNTDVIQIKITGRGVSIDINDETVRVGDFVELTPPSSGAKPSDGEKAQEGEAMPWIARVQAFAEFYEPRSLAVVSRYSFLKLPDANRTFRKGHIPEQLDLSDFKKTSTLVRTTWVWHPSQAAVVYGCAHPLRDYGKREVFPSVDHENWSRIDSIKKTLVVVPFEDYSKLRVDDVWYYRQSIRVHPSLSLADRYIPSRLEEPAAHPNSHFNNWWHLKSREKEGNDAGERSEVEDDGGRESIGEVIRNLYGRTSPATALARLRQMGAPRQASDDLQPILHILQMPIVQLDVPISRWPPGGFLRHQGQSEWTHSTLLRQNTTRSSGSNRYSMLSMQ